MRQLLQAIATVLRWLFVGPDDWDLGDDGRPRRLGRFEPRSSPPIPGRRRRVRSGPRESAGLRCDWVLELRGPDGQMKDRRAFTNLIVNAGLDAAKDRLFNPATAQALFGYCAIGTGAVPEAAGDVALGTEVARDTTTYTAGGVGVCVVERTFAAGVGTGAITEAGLFDAVAPGGTMFNRKTFAAVNKAAGDSLKASCTITLANA
jgi:hypothetical protein